MQMIYKFTVPNPNNFLVVTEEWAAAN